MDCDDDDDDDVDDVDDDDDDDDNDDVHTVRTSVRTSVRSSVFSGSREIKDGDGKCKNALAKPATFHSDVLGIGRRVRGTDGHPRTTLYLKKRRQLSARTFKDGNKKESRDKSEGFLESEQRNRDANLSQVPLRKDYNFVKEDELESNSSNERVEPICPRVTFNVKYKDRRIYGTRFGQTEIEPVCILGTMTSAIKRESACKELIRLKWSQMMIRSSMQMKLF
uniref:Uncharacterized protein n=1 Tax=Vespula pensylvanica TaxID=30213 RepID=A0A834KUV5_VESPE|nr:hypothetical protein H0235_013154 [Vespula pensylvanica]